jgi:membrane-bound serine protease (ClpP class)
MRNLAASGALASRARSALSLAAWIAPALLALLAAAGIHAAPRQGATPTPATPPAGAPARARVIELHLADEVDPIMTEYINEGIDRAASEHASLVLITMDTPGGLESSMMQIIQHILASPVPVAVYVSPTGSRGASAGFFILLSADVAAMAPGTHTGAASPLEAVGGVPINVDDTLKKKILNDATAFLRSYAEKRGRNVMLAETAVTDGKAFTETEALNGKLIDLVAKSPEDLLAQLDGRTIARFDGSKVTLDLKNPERVPVEMSAQQKFLARIVQPDVFFILLIVGVLGLYVEFTHPGMVAPGAIGAIALVLALYAMHILPVNFAGLLLIVVALGLFILEAKYTSHGVLAVGGIVAMLIGALMLIRSPMTSAGVSLGVALGVTAPFAAVTIVLTRLVLRSRGWKQSTGPEQLVGASAEVTELIEAEAGPSGAALAQPQTEAHVQTPVQAHVQQQEKLFQGMVRLRGELWRAVATEPVPAGTRVRVLRISGLTAYVAPADQANARGHQDAA